MALDLLSIQDQIIEKLREIPQDVYDGAVPDDKSVKIGPSGLFLPYVVIYFSEVQESSIGRGLTSVRDNTGVGYCAIDIYAPTPRASRQIADLVRDKLLGFQPENAGQLRPSGGRNFQVIETNAVPKKYVSEMVFTFIVNTVVS